MPGNAFDHLRSPALRALLEAEGFERPTAAQEGAIPEVRAGKHTLLIAPTGMGKTESALLPLLDTLLEWKRETPKEKRKGLTSLLYVTPLRALNRDLLERLESWSAALDIDVRVRHGDTPQRERQRQSLSPPDVLITTPETLQLLFLGKRLKGALKGVKWVVIDEVHELAADERGAQLAVALERLAAHAGEFQRVGLSATVGDATEVAAFLGGARRRVEVVRVPVAKELNLRVISPRPTARDERTADLLHCRPDAAAYLNACLDMIESRKATLLFVNTRETAEVLAARIGMLADAGRALPRVAIHHGSLSKDVRVTAEEEFKRGVAKALICTSSMELGIDIGDADLVIQYTSPRQVTRLVQRVGRAGHRADLVSNGVVIGQDPDDLLEALVIAERTRAEKVERSPSPRNPLDVLANQLAAMALEGGRVSKRAAYDLVTRAHPFRDLPHDEFERTLAQTAEAWVLWMEGDAFGAKKGTRDYFFENISMIPDSKTYRIVNIVTNRAVATLDEGFVASFVEPSATFICQGHAWRVAEIVPEEGVVRVEPVKDPLGAIPSWVGEEIPVPFGVAEDVGRAREEIRALVSRLGEDDAVEALARERGLDLDSAWRLVAYVEEQGALALPTDRRLTLEFGPAVAVLNACFGTRVNETLGRLLSSLLTARVGASVGLQVDPYRVILTFPGRVPREAVKETLASLDPDALHALLELVLTGSHYLRYRLLHVARKFGAVKRDVDYKRVNVGRLLEVFRGTPLYREAMREVFEDKLDVPETARVLREIAAGEREIVMQELSPIARAGLDSRVELISPARADKTLLEALKKRLLEERVLVGCVTCREWTSETRVARAMKMRECPKCHGRLLGVTRPWNELGRRALTKKKLGEEERAELKRLTTGANLVFDHGERALLALVARGVGPDTAGRLLHRQRVSEDVFLRDVLEAEVTYARTRAFWD